MIIMINSTNDPGSSLATWSSLFLLFTHRDDVKNTLWSTRYVPYWQLGLSMALLILGFLFTTWLSAKIYRTGILMYGKKPNWKEMVKWMRR
jgi:ABC-2 type transport system permease protein